MFRAILITLILIASFSISTLASVQTAHFKPQTTGEKILKDRDIFPTEFIHKLNLNLLDSDSIETVFIVPDNYQIKIHEIQKKYGEPDLILTKNELACSTPSTLSQNTRNVDSTIFFYGKIGFGVDNSNNPEIVTLITTRVSPGLEDTDIFKDKSDHQSQEVKYDGNWLGTYNLGQLAFVVRDNSILLVQINFRSRTLACEGFIRAFLNNNPVKITNGSFSITNSSFIFNGIFNDNNNVSGKLVFLLDDCFGTVRGSFVWDGAQKPGDVALTINPTSQNATAGTATSASFAVNVQGTPGFSKMIGVSAAVTPFTDKITLKLSSPNVNPGSMVQLTASIAADTPPNTYTITVIGAYNETASPPHTGIVDAKLNLIAPSDFTLGINPNVQTIPPGKSTNFSVMIQGLNGFNSSVSLSAKIIPQDSNLTVSFSPTAIMPGEQATLTVGTTANAPTGEFTIEITGQGKDLVRTATVTVKIEVKPDFSLTITPAMQTVLSGAATNFMVEVQPTNNFNQAVTLSTTLTPPNDSLTVTVSPSSLTPGNKATLTVNTTPTAPTSTFTVTVTGTAEQLTHTTTAITNVIQPDYSLTFASPTQTISRGQKGTITVTITRTGGFSGNVSVTAPDVKALKAKLTPLMQSTTGASVTFNLKTKATSPTGTQQLVFTGKDDAGRTRTATLSLVIQ